MVALVVCAAVYAVIIGLIGFWPTIVDKPIADALDGLIADLHARGIPDWVDYALIEFVANIVLFMPVGFLAGAILPRRTRVLALAVGPVLSAGIELVQLMLLSGRFATVSDVVANTIGATLGVLFAAVVLRGRGSRDRARGARDGSAS